MIAPPGLSASVTPAIDAVSIWPTAGVASLTVSSAHRLGVESGHQHDRLIGELQPLDVGEAVGAVGDRRRRRRRRPALSVTVVTPSPPWSIV